MNTSFYSKNKWNWRCYWLIVLFCVALPSHAQILEIQVKANHQPLSEILKSLTEEYDIQLSYNYSELSKYKLTVNQNFHTPEETVRYLIMDLPFELVVAGDVFIVKPLKIILTEQEKVLKSISGQVVEFGSREPLPHSQLLVNGHQIYTDILGNFNFSSTEDSVFRLQVSHLGYFIMDTLLMANNNHLIALTRAVRKLPEVIVRNNIIEKSAQIGNKLGNLKLNHQISDYLPGQGDNSVFTLLRLMPGIQATGEQINDLVIWGSYEGQSLITFDEFTLFGLRNYNENINVVNPFIIKSIEIDKGGYEAKYGNRVGGLVNIMGKNGNRVKPRFSLNINPSTINGIAEVPLFKRSSLILAYRQTYYNIYDLDDFNIFALTHSSENTFTGPDERRNVDPDISVFPDKYNFRDYNIKYTYELKNEDVFYVSYYRGGDVFDLATEAELERTITNSGDNMVNRDGNTVLFELALNNEEKNKQQGFSTFYNKKWKNGNLSKLMFSHADFSKKEVETVSSSESTSGDVFVSKESRTSNEALENSIRSENILFKNHGYKFEFGGGLYYNRTEIRNNNAYTDNSNLDTLNYNESYRAYLYAQQDFPITQKLKLIAGIRGNFIFTSPKVFAEPRLNLSYQLNDALKVQASWGLFNQIMYKMASVDLDDNYTYLWTINQDDSEGLKATHWVSGVNYYKNNFTINIEGYYKSTSNLTRRFLLQNQVNENVSNEYSLYRGNARTYGIDTYIRKDFGHNTIWASYTLSRAEERLAASNEPLPNYSLAPHDQRHEFKIASIMNYRNFYVSGCYIYGSGMDILKDVFDTETGLAYNRVDFAVTYNFYWKKMKAEAGISILNLFDTQNLTQRNVKTIDISDEISPIKVYTDAVPFTPMFFVKARF